ncbi:hypothetical protein [Streptomyces prasinopilosus]|uniref:Peptidoglycan binding domain-containing protein n=1 Tax=Streptomyces prasinopilosus TaxID=67344 RepID=A0A1G6NDG9_9ACTN|nr:hypothetical protein [Streptomyces prasinopilosus]SDC65376.1 hypothetical protein SAMN05216505_10355 [Streptomyces prasinopilosus]
MSRETDTPSTGPNGRGGAAYPSGTPPYGIPAVPAEAAAAGRPATGPDEQRADERKTETTLTTRVRINIPGSRPIPPVVVRKAVKDGDGAGDDEGRGTARGGAKAQAPAPRSPRALGAGTGSAPGTGPGAVEPSAAAAPGGPRPAPQQSVPQQSAPADKPASDWFAPRKSGAGKSAPGGGPGNPTGTPGGSGPAGGTPGPSGPAGRPGASGGGARPAGVAGGMSVTGGGARPGGTNGSAPGGNGSGLPGATGGPVAPGHGGGTGSFDVTEALAAGPRGGTRPGAGGSGGGEPRLDDMPFFTDDDLEARNGRTGYPGGPGPQGQSPYGDQSAPGGLGGPAGPGGHTAGPVTGRTGPLDPQPGGGPRVPHPGGGLGDDTASLTPQFPAPEPGAPGHGARRDNVSGHTVTSSIPVVPASASFDSFDADFAAAGPGPHPRPAPSGPATPPPAASSKAPKKKGRGKLPLLGGAVILLVGGVYGAGLLMNHSDVPKGTTVLGVDIGGSTRDEAVKTLDKALADRLDKPLKLAVGDKTVELEPDKAGLQLDTDATVGAAARSDYNPVSVIGSLFGNSRVVAPVVPVDEEKLHAALESAGGGSGNDGTITFESGKAVAVYGKPGAGIDVDKSAEAVAEAYRAQVETGSSSPVTVPTTTREPTVSKAEVDRMMKEFAEPAMSALVTVQTDAAHQISFSPEKSLWKFLGVKAQDGKLVEYYDRKALQELYGDVFDGVLITRGNGEKTPVTVEDVIGALRPALQSTGDRVGVIETDPS